MAYTCDPENVSLGGRRELNEDLDHPPYLA